MMRVFDDNSANSQQKIYVVAPPQDCFNQEVLMRSGHNIIMFLWKNKKN